MSIQDYSKKIQHFLAQLNVFYRINKSKEMFKKTSQKKLQKILGIQPNYTRNPGI